MHDEGMTADWDRLAGAIRERRTALNMSQQQLADAAGVTRSTIKNLEGARQPTRLPPSITAVEQVLGWTAGSGRAVLNGGEPTIIAAVAGYPPAQDPNQPLSERLPVQIIDELSAGEVYAAEIHDLTVDGGMRIITVAVRHPNEPPGQQVSPEQRRLNHRAWSRMQRKIKGLPPLEWEPGDPEEWKEDQEG